MTREMATPQPFVSACDIGQFEIGVRWRSSERLRRSNFRDRRLGAEQMIVSHLALSLGPLKVE